MDLHQRQKMTQRMSLTPQMKQSLHLLQLPLIELRGYLEAQIEENPVLEAKEKDRSLSEKRLKKLLEVNEKSGPPQYNSPDQSTKELQDKQRYRENIITKDLCLHDHLMGQLRLLNLPKDEYLIAEAIIADIDENGYLRSSLEEITALLQKKIPFNEVKIRKNKVENMLVVVQTFEPAGIAARSLKECLMIQLNGKKNPNPLTAALINGHLPDIAKNKAVLIAKKLKKPLAEIRRSIKEISLLEPKPGRLFDNQQTVEAKSSIPDVILEKNHGKLEVIVNTRWLPTLSVNKQYKQLLKSGDTSQEVKEYLNQKVKSASWLIKALAQRDETIRKISECILLTQKDFLNSGDFSRLKPLTLKEIANKVGRNESTVSRVVNSKYIRTPIGTYKLNSFFSARLPTSTGEHVSNERIKSLVHEIIEEENPDKPFRDSAIAKMLTDKGIKIARRTIAKYREELGIPAYHQRKNSA
jgi:RNA polymerase sigma-54 factor